MPILAKIGNDESLKIVVLKSIENIYICLVESKRGGLIRLITIP